MIITLYHFTIKRQLFKEHNLTYLATYLDETGQSQNHFCEQIFFCGPSYHHNPTQFCLCLLFSPVLFQQVSTALNQGNQHTDHEQQASRTNEQKHLFFINKKQPQND